MVEIYSIRISDLPEVDETLASCFYADRWLKNHPHFKRNGAARASLGALLLLQAIGYKATLCHTPTGRPFLENVALDFNISHTEQFVFCALDLPDETKKTLRVGLDAESLPVRASRDYLKLAERWFSQNEQEIFLKDPSTEHFLRIWTRKEALVKWTGEGLGGLQRADTVTAPAAQGIAFWEYAIEGTAVTLCTRYDNSVPQKIKMLSKKDLLDRLAYDQAGMERGKSC